MRTRRVQTGKLVERGRKRKYWYGRYFVTVKDENGNDVREETGEFLGYKSEMTRTEARQKLQQQVFAVSGQGRMSATDKVTLAWFWENRYLPARKTGWADSTAMNTEKDWRNYLAQSLGQQPLSEIEPFLVQQHINQLAGRGLAKSVVKKAKTLLSSMLGYAVDLKFLPSNPMVSASGRPTVRMPKIAAREKPIVLEEQMAQLIALVTDLRDRLILVLAYYYGLSAEEVFGLTWDSIDDQYIHIRNVAWRGKLYRNHTKRDTRRRNLPMHPDLRSMLRQWEVRSGGKGTTPVFAGQDGQSPMWYTSWLEKRIVPIARSLGIAKVNFQIMRRTFSTEELARDPKSVQGIMGHGTPDMTANIYAQSQEKHMAALLNERWLRLGLGETRKVQ